MNIYLSYRYSTRLFTFVCYSRQPYFRSSDFIRFIYRGTCAAARELWMVGGGWFWVSLLYLERATFIELLRFLGNSLASCGLDALGADPW